jgi:Cu/Ag efflux pump CusA
MIDWFVVCALGKRLVVAMICVFVSIYGYYSWTQLAIEAYPSTSDTTRLHKPVKTEELVRALSDLIRAADRFA